MKILTRSQAIADLRRELLRLVDENTSLCRVAARRGLFCNGFGRWSRAELELRFPWLLAPATGSRAELERRADRWQLASQDWRAGRLPCDLGMKGRASPCSGWDEFYESELAQFHRELVGEDVRVVPDWLARFQGSRPTDGG